MTNAEIRCDVRSAAGAVYVRWSVYRVSRMVALVRRLRAELLDPCFLCRARECAPGDGLCVECRASAESGAA